MPQLGIVRTSWLFGPGRPDFPTKIVAAAERARVAREPLRAVGDEYGCPTFVADLAEAIVELAGAGQIAGTHHVVNGPWASRADWARDVIERAAIEVPVETVPGSTWARASTPPRWASSRPPRCRPASRCGPGPRPWPTTRRRCCAPTPPPDE